jgi:hypothetical protein
VPAQVTVLSEGLRRIPRSIYEEANVREGSRRLELRPPTEAPVLLETVRLVTRLGPAIKGLASGGNNHPCFAVSIRQRLRLTGVVRRH